MSACAVFAFFAQFFQNLLIHHLAHWKHIAEVAVNLVFESKIESGKRGVHCGFFEKSSPRLAEFASLRQLAKRMCRGRAEVQLHG